MNGRPNSVWASTRPWKVWDRPRNPNTRLRKSATTIPGMTRGRSMRILIASLPRNAQRPIAYAMGRAMTNARIVAAVAST